MSERKITVSDGTNFFVIPVSDLDEARADGFYIPAHRGRTIVSDGQEIFEIPVEDLADATADEFYDVLAVELEFARSLESEMVPQSEESFPGSDEGFSTAASFDVSSPESDHLKVVAASASMQTIVSAPEGTVTFKTLVQRLLHPTAAQRRELLARGGSCAIHVGVIFMLATMILPSIAKMEEVTLIASAGEPDIFQPEQLEMMDLNQPIAVSESLTPNLTENFVNANIENISTVAVNINDLDLGSMGSTVTTGDVGGAVASAMGSGEFGGRSKAGRSALVARMGGSAASEKAVHQGLGWMAKHQAEDGGWSFDHTGGDCKGSCSQPGSLKDNCRNAATGMAILAMLGAGNTPFEGDFQESVLNGVKFLLAHSNASPAGLDFRGQHATNTGMYSHAIATTALCETLAMLRQEVKRNVGQEDKRTVNKQRIAIIREMEPAVAAAIQFIVSAQNQNNGSWGYNPGDDGDTSILGWQMMAMKSAANADVPVNLNAVRGANVFLDQVQAEDGMYGYRSTMDTKPSTTAIGLVCRMLSGVSRDEPRLKMGVERLSAIGPERGNMYFNYYATQVMLHYGGEPWEKWNAVMREYLVTTQHTEGHAAGSWDISDAHGGAAGRLYMTCLCTMTLEVYYRHLPLYGIPDEFAADGDKSDSKKKTSKSKKK